MVAAASKEAPGGAKRVYRPYGGVYDLFRLVRRAIEDPWWYAVHHPGLACCEGPAGCGKTYGIWHLVRLLCETYPGLRVAVVREQRKDLNDTVLVTWEQKVLGHGHPALGTTNVQPQNRFSYRFPNGSVVVPAGMDNPGKLLGSEWDLIYFCEAYESTLEKVELLASRVRQGTIRPALSARENAAQRNNAAMALGVRPDELPAEAPAFGLVLCDTNPEDEANFLNTTPEEPHPLAGAAGLEAFRADPKIVPKADGVRRMARYVQTLDDNPFMDPGYRARLAALTGAQKDRFYLGKWVGKSGQVYPMFRRAVHVVPASAVPKRPAEHGEKPTAAFRWTLGAMDWGFEDPLVIQVWGVVGSAPDQRAYRIFELYQTGLTTDDACDVWDALHRRFGLARIVCPPERPELIEDLNRRLGGSRGRGTPGIAVRAENSIRLGIDTVRHALGDPDRRASGGEPKLFLVEHVHHQAEWGEPDARTGKRPLKLVPGRDPRRLAVKLPACTEDEFPQYLNKPHPLHANVFLDEPLPNQQEHGLDCTRYAARAVWLRDFGKPEPAPAWGRGTFGEIMLDGLDEDEAEKLGLLPGGAGGRPEARPSVGDEGITFDAFGLANPDDVERGMF